MSAQKEARTALVSELRGLLNRHCAENLSDTPDHVLAEYLMGCLDVWETAVRARDAWYGDKRWRLGLPEAPQ